MLFPTKKDDMEISNFKIALIEFFLWYLPILHNVQSISIQFAEMNNIDVCPISVSYTHLTLPTIYSV